MRKESFRHIDFVITGMPRSGTTYTANLLKALGIECGHEFYYNQYETKWRVFGQKAPFGDVSWKAVPNLHTIQGGIIAYQTRNHIDVLNSLGSWSATGSFLRDSALHRPYVQFVTRVCLYDIINEPDERVRMIEFYKEWMVRLKGRVDFTYDVSELQDPLFTRDLVKRLCDVEVSVEQVQDALSTTLTNEGTHGETKKWAAEFLEDHLEYKAYFDGRGSSERL